MEEEAFTELLESVAKNGQRDEIGLLDGRDCRWQASIFCCAMALAIEPRFTLMPVDIDPLEFVITAMDGVVSWGRLKRLLLQRTTRNISLTTLGATTRRRRIILIHNTASRQTVGKRNTAPTRSRIQLRLQLKLWVPESWQHSGWFESRQTPQLCLRRLRVASSRLSREL